jgi:PhnB protein
MSQLEQDRIVPEIIVHGGVDALEFYKKAFGAVEVARHMAPDGRRLGHGELTIGGHQLFVCDEFDASEGGSCRSPRSLGGTAVRITLAVEDADATVSRAVAAGARVTFPVRDMYWGARYGKVVDPFGHEWGINQPQRALTAEETDRAAREWHAKNGPFPPA